MATSRTSCGPNDDRNRAWAQRQQRGALAIPAVGVGVVAAAAATAAVCTWSARPHDAISTPTVASRVINVSMRVAPTWKEPSENPTDDSKSGSTGGSKPGSAGDSKPGSSEHPSRHSAEAGAQPLRCTKVVTDPAKLRRAVAGSRPDEVICMRGGPASAATKSQPVGKQQGRDKETDRDTQAGNADPASRILTGKPRQTTLHTTGYSYEDNQPGDNGRISCGIIHKNAGGTGTYDDPITVAVPEQAGEPGAAGQHAETPCGTRIYVPAYQKYFLVEDTGATKYDDAAHIDIYVGAEGTSAAAAEKCMDAVSTEDGHPIAATINPEPDLPAVAGPITQEDGTCRLGAKKG